jgi:hypothetical protein
VESGEKKLCMSIARNSSLGFFTLFLIVNGTDISVCLGTAVLGASCYELLRMHALALEDDTQKLKQRRWNLYLESMLAQSCPTLEFSTSILSPRLPIKTGGDYEQHW